VDVDARRVSNIIPTGAQTTALLLNRAEDKLFAANSGSDTVSIVSVATEKVEKTILLRPPDARGIPGATPLGLALSPDEATLYVALADMNAVAVVDLKKNSVTGYVPAGWYPTSVVASPDGARLFVVNAKGVAARNPNGAPVAVAGSDRPQYVQNIIEGTVSTVELAGAFADLPRHTSQVLTNNRVRKDMLKAAREALKNPGIEHVIYVVKENRTYDQVLGDLPQGNGDPKLLLFGRDVTPNQHALAERFVLLDNFYCCAEVSGDGWNWSTQGMVTAYNSRNVVYGYTGKQRTYDYEGTNNGVRVDLEGIPDVSATTGGYFWDNCARNRVSFRNYGFFADDETRPGPEEGPQSATVVPNKKALVGKTSTDFRQYDTNYADSEAWVKHGLKAAPRQMASFNGAPSRMTVWLREFEGFVANKNLPRFQMVRLGRDHTAGTAPGQYSPRAMVADNDYAVGQLVEAVSKSPYWKKTAIFVIEDDAQNGYDHVDAHRSIAFVVSPYIRKGTKDSRFYNTDSLLRTMEIFLGLPPLNTYTAVSDPFYIFTAAPENDQPYAAILPAKEIIGEINPDRAYRAQDSLALLNPLKEESAPDEELNDILWHAIKGVHVPAPPRVYTLSAGPRGEEEED
jgi:YVTN family beta-propeller protein